MIKLYKRNQQGEPIEWTIDLVQGNKAISIQHGKITGTKITETFIPKRDAKDEFESRVKAKRKDGYKELSELKDNAEIDIEDKIVLFDYLNLYLPKYNTSNTGFVLPMLCKTLESNKPFTTRTYYGQYKINGLRCLIGAKKSHNLFNPYELTFQSREGDKWELPVLHDYLIHTLPHTLIDFLIEENAYLDGEIYLPGYSINEINSFVKNDTLPQHNLLQFWCYDLAVENMTFDKRYKFLDDNIGDHCKCFCSEIDHISNENALILLPNYTIFNYDRAVAYRDMFINSGFEGLVIRDINAEYGFDKRNQIMMKFKKIYDGYFDIVDVVPEGARRANLGKFVIKNDINDELFTCTWNAPTSSRQYAIEHKDKFIGKKVFVEYRERSGVNQVPFHAKAIKVFI